MTIINFYRFLKGNRIFKIFLYWIVLLSTMFYVFSIPAFSNRGALKYISYGLIILLILSESLYLFLYSKFHFNKSLIIPFVFVLFAFIGTIAYSHDYRRWLTLFLMLSYLLAFYFSTQVIDNYRKTIKIVIAGLFLFGLYFLYTYFYQIVSFSFIDGTRLGDVFDNVNAVGFYFCIAFSLSMYLALMLKKISELLFFAPAILFFVLGVSTGSRSFIVVTAVAMVIVLFIRLRKKKLLFFISLAAVIVLSIILVSLIPFLKDQFERTIYTLFGIGNSKVDSSTVERAVWIRYGLTLGSQSIIFGYGVNGFSYVSGLGTYAHNNFIEVFCNFGLVGFILYYFILVYPFFKSILSRNVDIYVVSLVIVLLVVRGLFGVTYYSKESYALLGISYYFVSEDNVIEFRQNEVMNVVEASKQ